ncbi:sigma factor-like helix-turn-helix DNA-binding protein [Streptomyces liangshanensis]|uniref:sigma factor-like helix-turn-helix DNA-binding protein n=1 Tax=Streptomyces liangshanensis TaxID=2717324 RepID=UPI001AAE244F|nr:sigma factor-like helix-turn-helix DNA-binding protein [Streptomyces liangshanensis]
MRQRQAATDRRRAREFEAFVAGAAGRLLHAATLLTAEPADPASPRPAPRAQRLLTAALARTYARWDELRGEDPYDVTRQDLALRYAHGAWRTRHHTAGILGPLRPRERVVLVLRLYEGVAEEQTAALIGLPPDRVRMICARAVTRVREAASVREAARTPAAPASAPAPAPSQAPAPARKAAE